MQGSRLFSLLVPLFIAIRYAFGAKTTGVVMWKTGTYGAIQTSPAFFKDTVIIGSDDGVLYGMSDMKGYATAKC